MELTQAYVRECFDYDPATGNLIWRARPQRHFKNRHASATNSGLAGQVAGTLMSTQYRLVTLDRKTYLAHRLVWFWHHGRFPCQDMDHINRIRSDNRIENLRECSKTQNQQSRRSWRASGSRGVEQLSVGTWRARIQLNGRPIHLGTFFSEKAAALAYARAAVDFFGSFAPVEAKELFEAAYP